MENNVKQLIYKTLQEETGCSYQMAQDSLNKLVECLKAYPKDADKEWILDIWWMPLDNDDIRKIDSAKSFWEIGDILKND